VEDAGEEKLNVKCAHFSAWLEAEPWGVKGRSRLEFAAGDGVGGGLYDCEKLRSRANDRSCPWTVYQRKYSFNTLHHRHQPSFGARYGRAGREWRGIGVPSTAVTASIFIHECRPSETLCPICAPSSVRDSIVWKKDVVLHLSDKQCSALFPTPRRASWIPKLEPESFCG